MSGARAPGATRPESPRRPHRTRPLVSAVSCVLFLSAGSGAFAEPSAGYPVAGPFFTTYLACNGPSTSPPCPQPYNYYESGPCCATKTVKFFVPERAGDFPVFVYTVGTNDTVVDNLHVDLILKTMAEKGVIAAAPEYLNSFPTGGGVNDGLTCTPVSAKAMNIFDGSVPTSALNQLIAAVPEAVPGASVSLPRGVATAGFSQGSWVAVLAAEYEFNVRAAWAIGTGTRLYPIGNFEFIGLSECMLYTNTGLELIRATNGSHDEYFGPPLNPARQPKVNRENVQDVTGIGASRRSRARALRNLVGAGYYVVADAEVCDADTDHGFTRCAVCTQYALENGKCPREGPPLQHTFPLQGSAVCLNKPAASCPINGPYAVTWYDGAGNALYISAPDPFWTSTEASWGLPFNAGWLFRQLTSCGGAARTGAEGQAPAPR